MICHCENCVCTRSPSDGKESCSNCPNSPVVLIEGAVSLLVAANLTNTGFMHD